MMTTTATSTTFSGSTRGNPLVAINAFFKRREVTNGLIAGAVVIFFILIGLPGGTGDNNTLPPWFSWMLFMLTTGAFAYFAVRPLNSSERRNTSTITALQRGVTVGILAAVLMVIAALAINAGQLWEMSSPPSQLPTGLSNNITTLHDILWNVSERTTAVLAGLSEAQTNPAMLAGAPRVDPTWHFFLMALLLPVAGLLGSLFALPSLRNNETAAKPAATAESRSNLWHWLSIVPPFVLFASVVLNETLPNLNNSLGNAYASFVGGNVQLIGLLSSFLLIGSGLLAVRNAQASAQSDQAGTPLASFPVRAVILIGITLILFAVGLSAPSRSASDLLFSPKTPSLYQITGPNGSPQVVPEQLAPISDQT